MTRHQSTINNRKSTILTLSSMLGLERSALIGKAFTRFVLREDQDILFKHRQHLLETEKPQSCEPRLVKKDGHEFYARLDAMILKSKCEDLSQIRVAVSDITERKRLEKELREFATIDELTKVWNRRFFLKQADRQVKVQARSRRPLAVLILDIDRFKKVNDRFGHNIGDDALKTVSNAGCRENA